MPRVADSGVDRVAADVSGAPLPRRRPSRPLASVRRFAGRHVVSLFAGLVLFYLLLPVIVVIVFSFNRTRGRYNFTWEGFSLNAWTDLCGVPGLCPSMIQSLKVAAIATVVATTLAALIAYALVRHRFRGRSPTNLMIFLPMATPEVVMGSSLLALFLNLGVGRGFWTIVIGHIMFDISFVVVTVKARLQGQSLHLEEAAMDLYADEWTTFRKVTLPLMMPGIVAGALLAFALSFDDFIITNFVSGDTVTFPMFVWGAAQRGIPPQVNAMGTAIFAVAVTTVIVGQALRRRYS